MNIGNGDQSKNGERKGVEERVKDILKCTKSKAGQSKQGKPKKEGDWAENYRKNTSHSPEVED